MFGSKKQNAKVNGWSKTLDEYSDNKLHGHIGKLIEDKLDALEKKLTKQMLCKHENYSVKSKSFSPVVGALPIIFSYWKVCDDCGIDLGSSNAYEKEQREYEIAKQKVEQFEESQLKEPEDVPVEGTEYRGNPDAIRAKMRSHKIDQAVNILHDASEHGGRVDKHARAASIYSKAICEVIDIFEDLQD